MKFSKTTLATLTIVLAGSCLPRPASAQDTPAPSPGAPQMPDPAAMLEMAKPGENHQLLAELAGSWDYTLKFWLAPDGKPTESGGKATRKAIMGGRYFLVESKGTAMMPGPDGKLHGLDFEGMSIEGYDNVKKKFVATWNDSMGTGIVLSEGTYDAAAKTFTYAVEMEMVPGVKTKARETLKVIDKNHHVMEWFEDQDGKEVKTMEIDYVRKS